MKLKAALQAFKINPADFVCMDVGASTGGFTDCLLKEGAEKIYAVDVAYGQFAWELRKDPRVVVLERQNIRYLPKDKIKEALDLIVVDLSFISLKLVFPVLTSLLKKGGIVIALVKPQFEVKKEEVGRGGIVQDPKLHSRVLETVQQWGEKEGWVFMGMTPSPILGAKGNQEFLMLFHKL